MAMTVRDGGFFGPETPGLRAKVARLPRRAFRDRSPRLPRAVHAELGRIGAATRKAEQGETGAVATALERTLLHRATMGPTVTDTARIEAIGYDAWLDEQLDYERLDVGELEESLADALPTLSMSPDELYDAYFNNPFIPVLELWTATVFRAIYSPRQLFERMVIFWSDHFSIDVFTQPQPLLKPIDDRDVIRAGALGTFPELLSASAHSPAMLLYLTNDTNHKDSPNENYARELMELHTMGADNGYDETDVKEVARCFTGWTMNSAFRGNGPAGTFRFNDRDHDSGSKAVLGTTIAAGGGISDGERVLDLLVDRKETRAFIATKLLRYLWGYEPKNKHINKVKSAYQKSGGDIREMVRTALVQQRLKSATTKLKRPFHMTVSAMRALGAQLDDARFLLQSLREAGHMPFDWGPPNGYPDEDGYWSGFVLPRWNFAADLFESGRGTVTIDASITDPNASANAIANRFDELLFGGSMSASTRKEIKDYLQAGTLNKKRVEEALGLAISAPEFQEY